MSTATETSARASHSATPSSPSSSPHASRCIRISLLGRNTSCHPADAHHRQPCDDGSHYLTTNSGDGATPRQVRP